jgi:hypothetical protein
MIRTKIQSIIIAVGDGSARLNVENERRLKDWVNRRQLQHDSPVPAVSAWTLITVMLTLGICIIIKLVSTKN